MFGDPDRSKIIAYSAAFIGLIALGSWISVPFFSVPLTLQTLFVLLAGAVLKRYALVPVSIYVLMGAAGLPVFHNGVAGLGVLLGPTGGYLAGFIIAAFIAGVSFESSSRPVQVAGLAAATLVIYAMGIAWLMYSAGIGLLPALAAGVVPFIPGDIIKAGAAYGIARRLP